MKRDGGEKRLGGKGGKKKPVRIQQHKGSYAVFASGKGNRGGLTERENQEVVTGRLTTDCEEPRYDEKHDP